MTIKEILEQRDSLTIKQRKQIAYRFLYPILQKSKKEQFKQIFDVDFISSESKFENEEQINPSIANLLESKGILKNIDTSDISEEELYIQED